MEVLLKVIPIAIPVILVIVIFLMGYVKAPPDVAYIISGLRKHPKVLIGRAGVKIPFLERVDKLIVRQISIDIKSEGYIPTQDFIGVDVDAVAKVRVMTDPEGIQLAMKNFLNMTEDDFNRAIVDSLQGNMREIIGTITLKEICNDRKKFGDEVQSKAQTDMNALGIQIISCNIQRVTDENSLINSLGQDNMSKIQKDAAIAKAEAERDIAIAQAQAAKASNDAQVESDMQIAQKQNDLAIKQSELKVQEDTKRAEADAAYTIQQQVVTLLTTNGQAPFITVFMYLGEARSQQEKADLAVIIEEMLLQRYQGVKNEKGVWVTPAFPKLIYVLEEDNIHEDSKYWYLTELAAKCTAKRMVPDYISEKKMLELKVDKNGNGHCYPCMGCRSFLTPYVDENGKPKYYGRFNQGVVTVNLPDIALSSGGNIEKFWRIFDERMELCHRALLCRHERLKGTLSDAAPILWQYGACARLKKGEPIDKLLFGGYSTISLGYAGLYECVKYMTGKSHTDPSATPFALEVMNALNAACKKWKAQHNIDFSLYGTPLESTTYKFAKCLQKRFGVVEGITDKGYVTNSYHVHVTEPIDAFKKLEFEAQFQHLSPGGAISYVEVPDMQNNLDAVLEVMKFIYDHIIYAELNTKSDYCQVCGWDGEIEIVEQDGKLIWKCPQCGNTDQDKMNVARRTCGYIGTQFWNQGRTQEIKDRVLHL